MRILFDNGTPRQLRRQLFGHEIGTAMERGWATLANGVLLDRAEEAGYEVLITTDQGIGFLPSPWANLRSSLSRSHRA